jgi:hypothetical protein
MGMVQNFEVMSGKYNVVICTSWYQAEIIIRNYITAKLTIYTLMQAKQIRRHQVPSRATRLLILCMFTCGLQYCTESPVPSGMALLVIHVTARLLRDSHRFDRSRP